jgi:hypothetical protein
LTASPGWIFVVGNCDGEAGKVLVELSVVEQRYGAVLEVVRDGFPVAEVAARFGVSRQTICTWVANYEVGGLAGFGRPVASTSELSVSDRGGARGCDL